MSIKINNLEIENTKRIKAVKLEPTQNGLTVIGGKNGQGKTSVLDSIAWALGGEKFRPTAPAREGSEIPPLLKITLNNGLIVECKGKNSALKVTDPNGFKGGQQLLNEFVSELAIDLPKFINASDKEKANTLLQIIGIGNELLYLEKKEKDLYDQRRVTGQIADQKAKYAKEQLSFSDAPDVPISVSDLLKHQQEILARNGENQRLRQERDRLESKMNTIDDAVEQAKNKLLDLEKQKLEIMQKLETARKTTDQLVDESTEELEQNIKDIEEINVKVRANEAKKAAEADAKKYKDEYDALTTRLEDVRAEKISLLNQADLPLPGFYG